ncbi:hypothetical protein ACFLX2_00050 [Candidatus Dependentiae bacterium]
MMKSFKKLFLGTLFGLLAANPLVAYVACASKRQVENLNIYCLGDVHLNNPKNEAQAEETAQIAHELGARVLIEGHARDYTPTLDDALYEEQIREEMDRHFQNLSGRLIPLTYKKCQERGIDMRNVENRHDQNYMQFWKENTGDGFFGKACIATAKTLQKMKDAVATLSNDTIRRFCEEIIESIEQKQFFRKITNYLEVPINAITFSTIFPESYLSEHLKSFSHAEHRMMGLSLGVTCISPKNPERYRSCMLKGLTRREIRKETLAFTDLRLAIEIGKAMQEGCVHLIVCAGYNHLAGAKYVPGIYRLLEQLTGQEPRIVGDQTTIQEGQTVNVRAFFTNEGEILEACEEEFTPASQMQIARERLARCREEQMHKARQQKRQRERLARRREEQMHKARQQKRQRERLVVGTVIAAAGYCVIQGLIVPVLKRWWYNRV